VVKHCIVKCEPEADKLHLVDGMFAADEGAQAAERGDDEEDTTERAKEEENAPRTRGRPRAKRPPLEAVKEALERNAWVVKHAARDLGITRQLLDEIIAEHGLKPE
jgi:transcriptional regulator with GAF, ATPase, and Fis domain